jgi:DNA-binding LytR/AlgR family response regulator
VNSIDYLLKPIEERHLLRALDKIERLRAGAIPQDLASQLASLFQSRQPAYPERIATRLGERIQFLDLDHRIHRSTLLNLAHVLELDAWFEGRVLARLKDEKRTELQVSRDRAPELKKRLGV